MAGIIPSLVKRAWNKVFGGELDRPVYFAASITGNLIIAIASVIVRRVAFNAATGATPLSENASSGLVLGLLYTYWALDVLQIGFTFWCMVQRLHHAGKTAHAAVWYLVIVSSLWVFSMVDPAPTWRQLSLLVSVGFWIGVGILQPRAGETRSHPSGPSTIGEAGG